MENLEQNVRRAYNELTKNLIRKKLSITTMESATSGQIASLITDTEGASEIFKGAFVTYSNEAKIMQGVPKDIIEEYGVYSRQTVQLMAQLCRTKMNADIGVGVSATLGNSDPNNSDSVPGQAYFAIDFQGTIRTYHREIPLQPDRISYKMAVAKEVCDEIKTLIL